MATQPTVFPRFAVLDLNNGTGAAPNVVEPSAGKKDTGWNEGERPARETFNWLHRITNDWIEWFDQELSGGVLTGNFQELPALHSGLNFVVSAANFNFGGQSFSEIQTSTALIDDDVNYVRYDHLALDVVTGLAAFPGGIDEIPLFIVTTVAGAITNVVDVRTWATMPDLNTSIKNVQEIRTAGNGYDIVDLGQNNATPAPDCALGNIFRQILTVPTSVTFQIPLNPEALSANQTQEIIILLTLKPGDTASFVSIYDLVGRPSFGGIESIEGGDYVIRMVYDSILNWMVTVDGPDAGVGITQGSKIRKYKRNGETKNVAGVTDDSDLASFQLGLGVWRVKGFIPYFETPGNGGIDMNWQIGVGTVVFDSVWVTSTRAAAGSPDLNEFGQFNITNVVDLTLAFGLNDQTYAQIDGTFEVTLPATIDFQWAPVNASDLTLLPGSWIEFERLGPG